MSSIRLIIRVLLFGSTIPYWIWLAQAHLDSTAILFA